VGLADEQMTKLLGLEANQAQMQWSAWESSEDEEGRKKYLKET